MKIFIVTDIHGSAYWAQKAVEKFEETQSDVFVLLGDIYNHGPRNPFPQNYDPMRVSQILGDVADKIIAVRGNCDSEVDSMISSFNILQENVLFLGKRKLFFTHGHIHNKGNLPRLAEGDVMFYGHFHINEIVETEGKICVNISSCALPKDQSAYCLVDEQGISILDFSDNVILQKAF